MLTLPQMKYLAIHLMESVQNLYEENYKTLMKKTLEKLNKWRENFMFVDKKIQCFKMSVLFDLYIQCNPTQNTSTLARRNQSSDSKVYMERQKDPEQLKQY